jgi:nicotinamidase-related amidase
MLLDSEDSQLILLDYQIKVMPAIHEHELVLRNGLRLAQLARLFEVPTWGTEQNPEKLGQNAPEIKALCHRTLEKMHFSACAEGLIDWLRPIKITAAQARGPQGNARSLPKHVVQAKEKERQEQAAQEGRNTLVIAGCEAHVCLMQTALELLENEFEVWVVTDACSSRTERNRDAAFDRLASMGAELLTTEMVAFEWLRSADHPQFKAAEALIK